MKHMKITCLFLAILLLVLCFTGCAGKTESTSDAQPSSTAQSASETQPAKETQPAVDTESAVETEPASEAPEIKGELTVFAAASMTETLTELGAMYEADHPGVKVIFNFESSGTLKTQIQEGADCDLFISAAPKQMNQLDLSCDEEKNPDRLDFVDHDTRLDLLENRVVLAVPAGNPAGITSFDALAEALRSGDVLLAMGNSDVPVGQYTQKIFAYYGLDEETLASDGKISYGNNVKAVTTQVDEALADCGIIYQTDAFSAGLTVVDAATKDMCGQVIYPAAVLKTALNRDAAVDFLAFLQTPEAAAVFEGVGFTPLN